MKNMIVLCHENHEELPNDTPVHHFCIGFDHSNFVNSFRGSKYLPKLKSYKILLCVYFRI